jgi:hypothetical protein
LAPRLEFLPFSIAAHGADQSVPTTRAFHGLIEAYPAFAK